MMPQKKIDIAHTRIRGYSLSDVGVGVSNLLCTHNIFLRSALVVGFSRSINRHVLTPFIMGYGMLKATKQAIIIRTVECMCDRS